MNIIQLTDSEGNSCALYMTTRQDAENFQADIDAAFSDRDVEDIHENADDWLAAHKGIFRLYAEEVSTDAI